MPRRERERERVEALQFANEVGLPGVTDHLAAAATRLAQLHSRGPIGGANRSKHPGLYNFEWGYTGEKKCNSSRKNRWLGEPKHQRRRKNGEYCIHEDLLYQRGRPVHQRPPHDLPHRPERGAV